eukprot:TRINITY_DN15902_c0_g1_i1.p1 TRINITY_DN15902_c0_g1~~TRINITY_DN15902_c0_g1_i1.p1  ORF type:complete len:674 (+),score=216.85 TRINITY_DN15902_c0_g1_i1:45-2066(+)
MPATSWGLRWTDGLWEQSYGVRRDWDGQQPVTFAALLRAVLADDPCPAEAVRLQAGKKVLDLLSLNADQLSCECYSPPPYVVAVTRSDSHARRCRIPSVVRVQGAGLDTVSALRVSVHEAGGLTLRYFDSGVGGYCRLPAGDQPLPAHVLADGSLRVAIVGDEAAARPEPTPPTPVTPQQALFSPISDPRSPDSGTGSVGPPDLRRQQVRKGLSEDARSEAWPAMIGARGSDSEYDAMKRRAFGDSAPTDFEPRLVPTFHGELRSDYYRLPQPKVAAARRVLCVVASEEPGCDFCPALPHFACFFLRHMSEADACACSLRVLRGCRVGKSPGYAFRDPRKAAAAPHHLLALARDRIPQFKKVREPQEHALRMREWFDTLFTCALPLEVAEAVVDVVLKEGTKSMFRVALALMKIGAADSRSIERVQPSKLLSTAFGFSLSRKELEKLDARWERSGETGVTLPAGPDSVATYQRVVVRSGADVCTDLLSWERISLWLPTRLRGAALSRLFSSKRDGESMRTLWMKAAVTDDEMERWGGGARLVLVKAMPRPASVHSAGFRHSEVFGFFAMDSFAPRTKSAASGDSFCFTMCPVAQLFAPDASDVSHVRALHCSPTEILFGMSCGSGTRRSGTALSLLQDLTTGSSEHSWAYGNPMFCSGAFDVLDLEVFGFSAR